MIESFTITYDTKTKALPIIEKGEDMIIIPEKGTQEENSKIAHRPFLLEMQEELYVFNMYSAYALINDGSG